MASTGSELVTLLQLHQRGHLSDGEFVRLSRGLSSSTQLSGESTHEDVSSKVATQASMGMISALLAGFSLTALVEVSVGEPLAVSSLFLIASTLTLGTSTFVLLESTVEYMFVMRELHHGVLSALQLQDRLRGPRRVAEMGFVISVLCSLISCGCMVYIRFHDDLEPATVVSMLLLMATLVGSLTILAAMQYIKKGHQIEWRDNILQVREERRQRLLAERSHTFRPSLAGSRSDQQPAMYGRGKVLRRTAWGGATMEPAHSVPRGADRVSGYCVGTRTRRSRGANAHAAYNV